MTDYVIADTDLQADTWINVILDRSGSMNIIRDTTIEGFNGYLAQTKENAKGRTKISLHQFDSCSYHTQIITSYDLTDLSEASELTRLTYVPSGGTPLYDAVGQIISRIDEKIATAKYQPSILLVILTDGQNTDHHGYSAEQVKAMLEQRQESGWTVLYLGANQDAWKVGSTFGVTRGNAINYMAGSIDKAFGAASAASVAYATASHDLKALRGMAATYTSKELFEEAGVDNTKTIDE